MKIIRWLLSHIVLVLLIVVVIYGYMFWGRLADSDTPGGKAIAYLSNKFAPANEGDEQDIVAGLNAGEVSRENPADSTAKDVKNTGENNINASRKTVIVNGETSTSQQSKVSVNDTPSTIEDSAVSAGAPVKDIFVSPDVEEKLNNVDDIGEAVAASQLNPKVKSTGVKASWITARTLYHQRKYELSEKSYQQVIDNTEDNYDAYGELGNVYFNQGKNAQAASAYYEAAAILVRMGQRSRAESLIGLLWRLDPSKADELQKLIDSASS